MPKMNEVAAACMRHLCDHDWHGYTQGGGRWGDGEGVCFVEFEGETYEVEQGDRDCSSAVISAWKAAGLDVSATYTGNMRQAFLDTGLFEVKPMSFIAQVGDIYLNDIHHTAMCVSVIPDVLCEFYLAENGGIYGQVGDQTGWESRTVPYYDFPWDCILHYTGNDAEEYYEDDTPEQVEKIGLRVCNWQNGWLPWTCFPDYAGWDNSPITYLNVSCEWPIDVRVHTLRNGWLPTLRNPSDSYDLEQGTCGDGSQIDAISMYLYSPNCDYAVHYRVRAVGQDDYFDVQIDNDEDNGQDGYAGVIGMPIADVQAWIERV